MYAFIVVILFLAYGLLLLFGLLHVAQELITRPSPHLFSFSDFDADQDNVLPGATESSSAAPNKERGLNPPVAIDVPEGVHNRGVCRTAFKRDEMI
jgi:hypothetical protein